MINLNIYGQGESATFDCSGDVNFNDNRLRFKTVGGNLGFRTHGRSLGFNSRDVCEILKYTDLPSALRINKFSASDSAIEGVDFTFISYFKKPEDPNAEFGGDDVYISVYCVHQLVKKSSFEHRELFYKYIKALIISPLVDALTEVGYYENGSNRKCLEVGY